MQRVPVVVLWQLIFSTLHRDLTVGYPVAVTADGCSEVVVHIDIVIDVIEPVHHIIHLSFFIRNHHRDDTSPVVGEGHLNTVGVFQHIEIGGIAVHSRLKIGSLQSRECHLLHGSLFLFVGTSYHGNQCHQQDQLIEFHTIHLI